jgi:hypothetical protein
MFDIDDDFEDGLELKQGPIIEENNDYDFLEDTEEEIINSGDRGVIDILLEENGIKDGKIKMINEQEEEIEVDFYDLSKEEQLEILKSFNTAPETQEVAPNDFLAYLEKNNLTVDQYLELYKEQIVKELEGKKEPNYEIDNYDDHELFLLDLKSKYDLTDEELVAELERELKNEALFNKKVAALRTEYKALEDQYNEAQQLEKQQKFQQEYDLFADTLVDIAVKTPELHGIELEDTEKNQVLSFLLDLDDKGVSGFYKELSNPAKLYEAAWFLRYGKEAFEAVKNAYEAEINRIKKDKGQVVVTRPKKNNTSSIYDLY